MTREIRCSIELRAERTSPGRVQGVLIEMGRVAGDRREVFTPGSARFPTNGLRLLSEHRGRMVGRFEPIVDGSEIRIDYQLPDSELGRSVAAEIRSGRKRGLSVEFYATEEAQVQGVREVRGALIDAAAVVESPAYVQARGVEVRQQDDAARLRRVVQWL